MEDHRSPSPSSSIASSHDEHETDLHDVRSSYPSAFTPMWFPFTPLRPTPMFNGMVFQPPSVRSATPIVRHNFKSIDELLSPLPNSFTSTPSQRNGKAFNSSDCSFQILASDDTGYSSQILSASSFSFRQNRESVDSRDHDEELENMKPTCASSPIPLMTKHAKDDAKIGKSKKIRTAFTDQQKSSLDRFYATNRYPDPTQMENLSRMLLLEEKVIRVWFQNKRSREKVQPARPSLSVSHQNSPAMALWQQMTSAGTTHLSH